MYVKKKRGDLLDLSRQLQEVVDRAFRQAMFCDPSGGKPTWVPLMDIAETPEKVLVILEVPGVRRADIDVGVEEGLLIIKGCRREFLPKATVCHHHVEIDRGEFHRVIKIPAGFRLEEAEAKLEDGLLTIHLPKEERLQAPAPETSSEEEA